MSDHKPETPALFAQHATLLYDGTMGGLLTAIFEVYDRRLTEVSIISKEKFQPSLLSAAIYVSTDAGKARRVWQGLGRKTNKEAQQQFFQTFLSEMEGVETLLLAFARHVFASQQDVTTDYAFKPVLELQQTARKVWREKHRMEAFVRFQRIADDLWFARIEPDYNVLPLIVAHFKSRYADMAWLIYDVKRGYGMHYIPDTGQVSEVALEWSDGENAEAQDKLSEAEAAYQDLWQIYYRHTGIAARKNSKLHLRHIPSRYWKYLTEKKV